MSAMFAFVFVLLLAAAVHSTPCNDGKNNVVQLADASPGNAITLSDAVGQTYNSDQTPSCYKSVASVQLPGLLKLISGSITINKQLSVKGNSKALLTLQKNSWLVGVVCKDGKSQNFLVPDKDCSIDICSLSKSICTVLETPGTHQLNELESDVGSNGTITLPSASSALKPLLKGQWKLELKLMVGDEQVMDINLPSNSDWLWLDE